MKISMWSHVRAPDTEALLMFYVSELEIFKVAFDYGMGDYLLVSVENESLGLQISSCEARSDSLRPIFTIAVSDVVSIFRRLKDFRFLSGAELLSDNIFEYPAGKSVRLRDPGGNIMVIEQPIFE
ncbi:hypothetical protein M4R22_21770 [Acidovorax sp. GBBC 3334]|uniref:VOC family protein n=1 Tax=Acidovorax sp. GBBC 3334 TaxID=2940496 RepID=UPI0023030A56|nr:hypothetical protein [Acidovorax sp. GBBC 3334]MDA8457397.1 hypothetical protein [Acidovorax sp. GBBC 3334]